MFVRLCILFIGLLLVAALCSATADTDPNLGTLESDYVCDLGSQTLCTGTQTNDLCDKKKFNPLILSKWHKEKNVSALGSPLCVVYEKAGETGYPLYGEGSKHTPGSPIKGKTYCYLIGSYQEGNWIKTFVAKFFNSFSSEKTHKSFCLINFY
uniref:Secreted protein n=1 Tax=Cacopsylla melanoneura TaxID=428564 RepID=A0A8D8QHV4_9HEMI